MTTKKAMVTHNLSKESILLSGDIELSPGPCNDKTTTEFSFSNPYFILHYRMLRHGLRPLNVGGGGDCLFKSISHQLYGDSSRHTEIRAIGVRYLTENPETFIESVVGFSWSQYLSDIYIFIL